MQASTVTRMVLGLVVGGSAHMAHSAEILECVPEVGVKERFIPVEMMTGEALPCEQVLQLTPVQRDYPFVFSKKGEPVGQGSTKLSGPVEWVGQAGKKCQVYERQVPKAYERMALTEDQTAMGRVYDERIGNLTNEGKFPVGLWKLGERRDYHTTLHLPHGDRQEVTSIEVRQISCTYNGIAQAMEVRWFNSRGLDYIYTFAPGKGLVQVINQGR